MMHACSCSDFFPSAWRGDFSRIRIILFLFLLKVFPNMMNTKRNQIAAQTLDLFPRMYWANQACYSTRGDWEGRWRGKSPAKYIGGAKGVDGGWTARSGMKLGGRDPSGDHGCWEAEQRPSWWIHFSLELKYFHTMILCVDYSLQHCGCW